MTYNLLTSHEITSTTTSVSIEGIPQDAKDLLIVISSITGLGDFDDMPFYDVHCNTLDGDLRGRQMRIYEGAFDTRTSGGLDTLYGSGSIGGSPPEHTMEIYLANYISEDAIGYAKNLSPGRDHMGMQGIMIENDGPAVSVYLNTNYGRDLGAGSVIKIYQIT